MSEHPPVRTPVPRILLVAVGFLCLVGHHAANDARADDAPKVAGFLEAENLGESERQLMVTLDKQRNDQVAQFSLGIVRFLQAIEHLGQAQHQYGLMQHRTRNIPFLRMPVPNNDKPDLLTYENCRSIFQKLLADLEKAEATLAKVDTTDVKVPIHFGRIRLDLNGDGKSADDEPFWKIFAVFNPGVDEAAGTEFLIAFDGGDVHWLRGYCHLLMGLCEVILAHDWKELFERTGHLAYPRVESPHQFLAEEGPLDIARFDFRAIADAVAFIHLINFEVTEPERMKNAHSHLQKMVSQSRASWTRILSETDNDHEWLPNPDQTGVIPEVRVRQEMIDGWHAFLDEAEALLQGQKLVPFWRGYKERPEETLLLKRGVNLKRFFTEPRRFDLVMWISGTGATPFLEEGELTDLETWASLRRIFGGEFFGFALWFN